MKSKAMVTRENYEEYLMLYADGELDTSATAELQAFLAMHPEFEEQLDAWQVLKLEADMTIVFETKDALLQREPKRIAMAQRPQIWVAAAAVLTALVMIPMLWPNQPMKQIAWKFPVPKYNPSATLSARALIVTVTEQRGPVRKSSHTMTVAKHAAQAFVRDTIATPDAIASTSLDILPIAAAPQIHSVVLATINEIPQEAPTTERERVFPVIRLAEANQPALNMLKQGLDARVSQITHAAKAVREAAFAVRIGNKNHYLNF